MNKNLNIRKMQAYAAICLLSFCRKYQIEHEHIHDLISHLIKILDTEDLVAWEEKGAQLSITGRGDPLPKAVENIVPRNKLEEFNLLVESCVEVGIVNMYGDLTEKPKFFLSKCIEILKACGLEKPSIENVVNTMHDDSFLRDNLSTDNLNDLLSFKDDIDALSLQLKIK